MASRALNLSAALNYHLQVPLVLLYLVVEDTLASLSLQLNLLFDILELLIDGFDFEAPLQRVKLRLENLVLLCLLEQVLLLLLQGRVEETYFSLFNACLCDISAQVCVARPAVFQYRLRASNKIAGIFLRLNLNSVDFLGALQIWIVLEVVEMA